MFSKNCFRISLCIFRDYRALLSIEPENGSQLLNGCFYRVKNHIQKELVKSLAYFLSMELETSKGSSLCSLQDRGIQEIYDTFMDSSAAPSWIF